MSEFTFGEFEELVHNFEGPLLVCFYKDGSVDNNYNHFIERLIKDIGDNINIIKADITNNTEIQNAYDIISSPELDIFYNGSKALRCGSGIYTSEYIKHIVDFVKIRNSFHNREGDISVWATVSS